MTPYNVPSPIAISFTVVECIINLLFNMGPIIFVCKIKKKKLNFDQVPLLMFLVFYLSSIVLFPLSLGRRLLRKTEFSVKELEKWVDCLGYGVSLITNIFALLFFRILQLDLWNRNFEKKPTIIAIIIFPVIIFVIIIAIFLKYKTELDIVPNDKAEQIQKVWYLWHVILIFSFTIIVSISPIHNFIRAHRSNNFEIIPGYTIIFGILNYLSWIFWWFYLWVKNNGKAQDIAERFLTFAIFYLFPFFFNLTMLCYYCWIKKIKDRNNDDQNDNPPTQLLDDDSDSYKNID
jgi:hypothetical protein